MFQQTNQLLWLWAHVSLRLNSGYEIWSCKQLWLTTSQLLQLSTRCQGDSGGLGWFNMCQFEGGCVWVAQPLAC